MELKYTLCRCFCSTCEGISDNCDLGHIQRFFMDCTRVYTFLFLYTVTVVLRRAQYVI